MVALREPKLILALEPEAAESLPKRVLQHFQRGNALYREDEFEKARHEYDAALALVPDFQAVLNNRGVARSRAGDHAGALTDFTRALELRPDDLGVLCNIGVAYAHLENWEASSEALDRVLAVRPDHAAALSVLSVTLANLDRYNEALGSINRYLALRPDDADAQALHRELLDKRLWELVAEGFARWSGGKPKGSDPGIPITPGPPISDYIIEDRR